VDIVCQLLKLGANPDEKDEHGWSANLCCTQSKPNPAMAELLTPGSSQCLQSLPLTDTLGPTRFSAKNKMTSMQLHNDGLEVSFEGLFNYLIPYSEAQGYANKIVDGNVDSEDALIQSNHPLSPLREIFGASDVVELTVYFEITVVEGGSPS
jgi:ankyrin repeat protein